MASTVSKRTVKWREFATQFCKDHGLKKWASAEHNALVAKALVEEGFCSPERKDDLIDLLKDVQATNASAFSQAIGMREEKAKGVPDYLKSM